MLSTMRLESQLLEHNLSWRCCSCLILISWIKETGNQLRMVDVLLILWTTMIYRVWGVIAEIAGVEKTGRFSVCYLSVFAIVVIKWRFESLVLTLHRDSLLPCLKWRHPIENRVFFFRRIIFLNLFCLSERVLIFNRFLMDYILQWWKIGFRQADAGSLHRIYALNTFVFRGLLKIGIIPRRRIFILYEYLRFLRKNLLAWWNQEVVSMWLLVCLFTLKLESLIDFLQNGSLLGLCPLIL